LLFSKSFNSIFRDKFAAITVAQRKFFSNSTMPNAILFRHPNEKEVKAAALTSFIFHTQPCVPASV
jgi:hypothetical protein